MKPFHSTTRRDFLKTSLLGGLAAASGAGWWRVAAAAGEPAAQPSARVALMAGEDHVDNTFRALRPFAQEVARAIGNRRVIVKPNNVAINVPLCATPVECLEGVLEFLKSIDKLNNVVIAESAAGGSTLEGFDNYRYTRLASKYPVKFVDLDDEGFEVVHVFDEKDFRPHAARMSKLLLDPDNYVISAAKMKTHDRVVATLSLKNIVFGAPIKDKGFAWGANRRAGTKIDKPIVHGSGFRGINYNLFALASRLGPDLAVIDGYQGMEGNGPVSGTAVDHRVCVAGLDWLAADRVAVELMGIDFTKVGYLNYCADAGLGVADLKRIEVVGGPIADHKKTYRLNANLDQQLIWMKAAQG